MKDFMYRLNVLVFAIYCLVIEIICIAAFHEAQESMEMLRSERILQTKGAVFAGILLPLAYVLLVNGVGRWLFTGKFHLGFKIEKTDRKY